jgi:hypothetical protein
MTGRLMCGLMTALLLGLSPAVASAQSVRGHGKVGNGPGFSPSEISVNAWLDAHGVAHGSIVWIGDVQPGSLPEGGPADPWFIDVTYISFDGNTALVWGTVAHSLFPWDIGTPVFFAFTDNREIGLPDEINAQPIEAGNITVDD